MRITEGLEIRKVSEYGADAPEEAIAEPFSAHYAAAYNEIALQMKQKCDTFIKNVLHL